MKYTVVVNRKYMLKVEAKSALGAEHVALDLHGGIETAQAFDQDGMKTETFEYFLNTCEFCSLKELEHKAHEYKTLAESVEFYKEERNKREAEIEKHLRAIEALKEGVASDAEALLKYKYQIENYWK